MPSKSKGAPKPKERVVTTSTAKEPTKVQPETIDERSTYRYQISNPIAPRRKEVGLHRLTPAERASWSNLTYARNAQDIKQLPLPNKAGKDLWKVINDSTAPLRGLSEAEELRYPEAKVYDWGIDWVGRNIGDYTPQQFLDRRAKRLRLTQLEVLGKQFQSRKQKTGSLGKLDKEEVETERARREDCSRLRMELYGEHTGEYALDPVWDDIAPILHEDGNEALASISYGAEYGEAMSYLRAVMAKEEHSPRCLILTESIIKMNPAHYTVWLYRFAIVSALKVSIKDEIEWLNKVSLAHLKNYQIWHHRQLLLDEYFPSFIPPAGEETATADNSEEVKKFALSELDFIKQMLEEDTKNYHVWSYRQYLTRKLGLWNLADEMTTVETLILEDVRNNSAWSHRFFLVFSNPKHSSVPEIPATRHDPAVPLAVTEREVSYATRKILEAPQNQSPWNYLKGVLARGGKDVADMQGLCEQYVERLGVEEGDEEEEKEMVLSTHALDMLAEIYAAKGETEKADLALARLADKWDPMRKGYWDWRRRCLAQGGLDG